MLLLVADTSGSQGRIGLVRAAENSHAVDIIEEVPLVGGAFSAQLIPQIASMLAKHDIDKAAIDAFIVVSGPGSFTGLRVGLAAIKALAEILRKPIVPVSLLEVLALAGQSEGKVLAAIDAGRGEVYLGEYRVMSGSAECASERLVPFAALVSAATDACVVTNGESLGGRAREAVLPVFLVDAISAGMIARVGLQKLRAGLTVTPERLEANYIRSSDAELFSKPLSNSSSPSSSAKPG